MKSLILVVLFAVCSGASAATLSCNFISSNSELDNAFLTDVTAEFNCAGIRKQFIGSNNFVSCKPQFTLIEFVEQLTPGEAVQFITLNQRVTSIDGSRQNVTMVRSAVSASGRILEPQTIIQHNRPVVCDPTQIQVI